ncbi:MAG: PAS domain S-box protein [Candidatus Bathyarchaeota archaeon]|nr:PAS domain S-box protein [Candidatus Bathyarchaeota archaeon]
MAELIRVTLDTILAAISIGVVVVEKESKKVSYANERAIELLGVDPRGLEIPDPSTKKVHLLLLGGGAYPPEKLPVNRALLIGKQVKDELIIERPDGSRVTVLTSAVPIKDGEGKTIASVGVFDDITEQKKAEEEVKSSELYYRTLIETSTDAIVVHKEGRFMFANPAALKLFGIGSFEELQNRTIFDFIPPQEQASVQARISSVQAGKKVLPREEEMIRADGRHLSVEATGAPIYYKGDWAVLAILRDITERKQMQRQLEQYAKTLEAQVEERARKIRENEQSYRELYESFGEAFIATDWELNVIHWNKAAERVTTVPAKDALGKKIYDVLPEMEEIDTTPYFEALRDRKPARFMMNTISRQTEQEAVFEVSTYPSTLGIIIIVEDKTEEERTKRLSAIGQTASMVGHDIRNPLPAITGDLYLLKEELKGMPKSKRRQLMDESIDAIDKNIAYINKIVSDLQDYTRPLKPNVEKVNLTELIAGTLLVENIPNNIETLVNVARELYVRTDPAYLRRALSNLIINAVQAMPNGGKLMISAQQISDKMLIGIADTGVGIPEEVKSKVFSPLFTTKAKGQGLGLAVVKHLLDGLNGKISFESQEGKGTKFTIELPV